MLKTLSKLSLRSKLLAVILAVTLAVSGCGIFAITGIAVRTFRADLRLKVETTTQLIAEYCLAPVAFGDRTGTREILEKLRSDPDIVNAYVMDDQRQAIAEYNRSRAFAEGMRACAEGAGVQATGDYVLAVQPMLRDGESYGRVCLRATTARLRAKILNFLATMALLLLALVVVSYALARVCQAWISRPLLDLAAFIRRVSTTADYTARARHFADDEIGLLADGFNDAIDKIVQRDEDRRRVEEDLLKARKIESIGLLAGGIAHDFNNLLTTMLGNVSLLKFLDPSDPRRKSFLDDAEQAALRARDLTRQLLTFSTGGAPIRQPTSFRGVVEETLGFVLRGSSVTGHLTAAPDLWNIDVDPAQVNQVLQNLVINAKDAMGGKGQLELTLDNVEVAEGDTLPLAVGPYVVLRIRDHGPGILPGDLSRIFDPYFTTKREGTGLGLSICYSVVKRHGGHIFAESAEGGGARFTVYLPASLQSVPKAPAAPVATGKGRGGRVLVMDDEDLVRDVCRNILSALGYEVTLAREGEEALRTYEQAAKAKRPFDLVILDLTVRGGMGGKEAAARLRGVDPSARILASSGYSNDPIMANYAHYGFCGVVSKPYVVAELERAAERALLSPPGENGGAR